MAEKPDIRGADKIDKLLSGVVSELVKNNGVDVEEITGVKEASNKIKDFIGQFAKELEQNLADEAAAAAPQAATDESAAMADDAINNFGAIDTTGMPEEQGEEDTTLKTPEEENAPAETPAPSQTGKQAAPDRQQATPAGQTQAGKEATPASAPAPAGQQAAPETAPTEGGQQQQPTQAAENAVPEAPTQPPASTPDREKKEGEEGKKPEPTTPGEKTEDAGKPTSEAGKKGGTEAAPEADKPVEQAPTPNKGIDKSPPTEGEQPQQPAGEQAGKPAPAAGGEAPTDKKPQKNYEPEGQMKQFDRKEKGGLTQNINQLRNRKELKNIDNNIKTAEKDIKNITKKLKKPLKELQKMQREKSRQHGAIFLLKIIKAVLYILGLLGVTLAAVPFVKSAITALKKKQEILESKIKAQKKEIEKDMNSKTQANIKIVNLEHQRRNIVNRSLLQSNAKQRGQEQQNDQDVGIA